MDEIDLSQEGPAQWAMTRRGFMIATGMTVLAVGVPSATGQTPATPPPTIPGKERLTVRSSRPINLETPLAELTSYDTPDGLFFVRNNLEAPSIDPAQWVLRVEGEVDQPLMLRLDDLRKLPLVTEDALIECAGNGRAFHRPRASGIQWEYGAVGNQSWRGVRLADVLAMAKVRPTGTPCGLRRRRQATDTSGARLRQEHSPVEGVGRAHHHRARNGRQAAAPPPRRTCPRAGARLRGFGLHQVGRADHASARGVRWVLHEVELHGAARRQRQGALLASVTRGEVPHCESGRGNPAARLDQRRSGAGHGPARES